MIKYVNFIVCLMMGVVSGGLLPHGDPYHYNPPGRNYLPQPTPDGNCGRSNPSPPIISPRPPPNPTTHSVYRPPDTTPWPTPTRRTTTRTSYEYTPTTTPDRVYPPLPTTTPGDTYPSPLPKKEKENLNHEYTYPNPSPPFDPYNLRQTSPSTRYLPAADSGTGSFVYRLVQ